MPTPTIQPSSTPSPVPPTNIDTTGGWFSGITQGISSLASNIASGIGDILRSLFVPNTEALNAKITSIKDKFAFVEDFKITFTSIKTYLLDGASTVPQITINLANAEGRYNYGTNAKVLDMSWYARYKPTVEKIIIAFTYILFIFTVYKRLPDIIAGAGAITERGEDITNGYKERKWGHRNDS